MNNIRDKIKIHKMEQVKFKEQFCEEHQCDIETIVTMVEDLVATAVACGSSPQNYSELQRAKGEFVNHIVKVSEKYRVVEIVGT